MVEGHACHRVAHLHRKLLVGKRFVVTSPNGRFVEGAAAVDGRTLLSIEVHGKYLFYFFEGMLLALLHEQVFKECPCGGQAFVVGPNMQMQTHMVDVSVQLVTHVLLEDPLNEAMPLSTFTSA